MGSQLVHLHASPAQLVPPLTVLPILPFKIASRSLNFLASIQVAYLLVRAALLPGEHGVAAAYSAPMANIRLIAASSRTRRLEYLVFLKFTFGDSASDGDVQSERNVRWAID